MINSFNSIKYQDRLMTTFVIEDNHYTKEEFNDGQIIYWRTDFLNSEETMIQVKEYIEIERILNYYLRTKKLERVNKK
jgi:hypothetical protein